MAIQNGKLAARADLVREQVNLAALVEQELGPPLSKSPNALYWHCPVHQEHTPSFVVHPKTNTFYCYGACADGGDPIYYIQWRTGKSFIEALESLEQSQAALPPRVAPAEHEKNRNKTTWAEALSYHANKREASAYFKTRGVVIPALEERKLGAQINWHWHWNEHRQHCYRYTIPDFVMGRNGPNLRGIIMRRDDLMCYEWLEQNPGFCDMVVSKEGRELTREAMIDLLFGPKYWKTPGYEGLIYNAQRLVEWNDGWSYPTLEYVLIVESQIDAITNEQAGYPTVQAKIGRKNAHEDKRSEALRTALHNVLNVFIVRDSDPAGSIYGHNMVDALGRGTIISTPPGMKDSNDVYVRGNIDDWMRSLGIPRLMEDRR